MITNKITDRITDKITDMTSKLQMLITFVTVVSLRLTISRNAQNSEENPDKGIWYTILCQEKASNCLNFVFKNQTPTFFFLFSFLFFFLISATFFFTWNKTQTIFFDTKSERHKKHDQEQERNKDTNKNATRRKQIDQKSKDDNISHISRWSEKPERWS